MHVGALEVNYALFPGWAADSRYVAGLTPEEFQRYFGKELFIYRRVDQVKFDGDGRSFYLCYVEDCWSPPVAVVRADSVEDAVDLFVDEFTWAQVSDEDVDPEREESDKGYSYTGQGTRYDGELVRARKTTLLSLHLEFPSKAAK